MISIRKNIATALLLMAAMLLSVLVQADGHGAGEHNKGTVLITGANRGIGLALANKFNAEGYTVIATARKPAKAKALKALGVQVQQLDVIDPASVAALSKAITQPVDILINNAGIGGHSSPAFNDLDVEQLKRTFDVNSLGALRVTQALLPNLQQGKNKTIASVSSIMGSISLNNGRSGLGYRASKAALNSFNKSLANEYGSQGFRFIVLHPGWVRTDMGSQRATYSVEESADGLFAVITGAEAKDNGHFYDLHGKELSW